ncbi:MAG TPA: LD-carboxypeptidase [Candidatus Baltobacteraceae bacterium]|nr:LD-carboxypeptidase [Candidatus Baltobacteraceae bacterium]
MKPLLAPALREGDTVALIAPAGPLASDEEFARAQDVVRSFGLVPRIGRNARAKRGYLAGSDAQRVADFNEAARDPQVRGIFALRGGYGTMRILDALDYDALAADPKVVLGYSDLTALLNAVTQRTGLVTFHGPVAALSSFSDTEREWLRRAVMQPHPLGALDAPGACVVAEGSSHGRLCGGNLSLVAALTGTPFEIDTSGALLFIEEVEEAPYRIDRMLTQLRLSGALSCVAGVLVGRCANCDVGADHPYAGMPLAQTLRDRLGDLGVPVVTDLPIGHRGEQWTLPIGARARIDGARIMIESAAVR